MLGVKYSMLSIEGMFEATLATLEDEFAGRPPDATEENIQSRCRMLLLMGISNKTGKMLLTTGNKSEMAVGYATLYGDMAGGFAPIKDCSKLLVYRLADYRNSLGRVIPQRVIERPPSAELRPEQKDSDSLPPYDVLDPILEAFIEEDLSVDEIEARGFDRATVGRVLDLVKRNEYKRRQAPPGRARQPARLWARLALSDHQRLPALRLRRGRGAARRRGGYQNCHQASSTSAVAVRTRRSSWLRRPRGPSRRAAAGSAVVALDHDLQRLVHRGGAVVLLDRSPWRAARRRRRRRASCSSARRAPRSSPGGCAGRSSAAANRGRTRSSGTARPRSRKAANDLRAVLGGRCVRSARNSRSMRVRRALEVDETLDVPGVVDARMRRVLADEGLGRVGRGLLFARAVICVDQIESRLARLVGEREACGQLLIRLDRAVVVVRLESSCGPSCRGRPGYFLVCSWRCCARSRRRRAGRYTARPRCRAGDRAGTLRRAFSLAIAPCNWGEYSESPACTSDRAAGRGVPLLTLWLCRRRAPGLRLDQALARALPQYSRARCRAGSSAGAVQVDGRPLRGKDRVLGGERVRDRGAAASGRRRSRAEACRSRWCSRTARSW